MNALARRWRRSGWTCPRFALFDLYRPAFPFPAKLATMVVFLAGCSTAPTGACGGSTAACCCSSAGTARPQREGPRPARRARTSRRDWEYSSFSNLAIRDDACSNRRPPCASGRTTPRTGEAAVGTVLSPVSRALPARRSGSRRPGNRTRRPGRLVATLDVFAADARSPSATCASRTSPGPGAWQEFTLDFAVERYLPLEFRVHYHDSGTLGLDVIRIRKVP